MGTKDLSSYYQEVFNFVASMTIKFSPLATALNEVVENTGSVVDSSDMTTWKYYLNITGQYHPSDTKMYISSLDTQQQILFSPATLAVNPKTAAAYVPGQPLYNTLCSLYPNQADLIKSIVYPVSDINTAIAADDFTVLAYGENILESDEYDIVLQWINQFLPYIQNRWYFAFFSYEPYFMWVFWGMLWQQMIGVVLLARIKAIKTASVHSWHIWTYLASYGLSDYSDILTRTQQLFLYRNIEYLITNRGKQTNLIALSNNLLSSSGVGLYGRDIQQEPNPASTNCILTPNLIPIPIPTSYVAALPEESAETVSAMEERLFQMGTEVDVDTTYLTNYTTKLASTPLNNLPTKLLEFRSVSTNTQYTFFLNRFLIDNLVWAIANNVYRPAIEITEPTTATQLSLSGKDALVLYHYCCMRALLETPVNIPTSFFVKTVFRNNATLPTSVMYNGFTYPVTNFTNVANYLGAYQWPETDIDTPEEFTQILTVQFLAAINQIKISRLMQDTIGTAALQALTDAVTLQEEIPLTLSTSQTYQEWFAAQPANILAMTQVFDSNTDPSSLYTTLGDIILSALLPATATFASYGNFAITDTAYSKLKQLFVQLCSYNILFLDSDSTVNTGIFLSKLASYNASTDISVTTQMPVSPPCQFQHNIALTETVPIADLQLTLSSHRTIDRIVTGGIAVSQTQKSNMVYAMNMNLGFMMTSTAITTTSTGILDAFSGSAPSPA